MSLRAGSYSGAIIGCTGDWFGGWTGYDLGSPDRFITEDLQGGRLPEVIAAEAPCILCGHWPGFYYGGEESGFAILQGFADVLNVRIQSPLAVRVKRTAAQQQISPEQAETLVKENDKARLAFIESFYKARWDAASAFDLVIDTSKVSPDLAAAWLVAAVQALEQSATDGMPTCQAIEVDPVLAGVVADALN